MFKIKIIDRYILKELIDPFLFGLAAFTSILGASMVLFDLVRAVVLRGMPFDIAIQLFVLKLPSIMVYIFPMAMLLAALLAFGRLSQDSEVIAFHSGGIPLIRLMIPVAVLGIGISLLTLVFSEVVVPSANKSTQELMLRLQTEHTTQIQENVFVPELQDGKLKRIFYARSVDGDKMEGVIVQEFNEGRLTQLVNADRAYWLKNKWLFENGIIYILSENGEYKHFIKFDQQQITIKYSPKDLTLGSRSPEEMNLREMSKLISLKKKMGTNVTDLLLQFNMKISIPFASLVFALLGAPLGLKPQRSSSSMGLGLSIIVIFIYYVLMSLSLAIGEKEFVSPEIAAWLPNLLTGGLAVYLITKAKQ
jgi:lipopolysaccharide export system permease protein